MPEYRRSTSRNSDLERHSVRIPAVTVVMLLLVAALFPSWQLLSLSPSHAASLVSTHGKTILQITPELGFAPPSDTNLGAPQSVCVLAVAIADEARPSLLFRPDLHNRPPPETI